MGYIKRVKEAKENLRQAGECPGMERMTVSNTAHVTCVEQRRGRKL